MEKQSLGIALFISFILLLSVLVLAIPQWDPISGGRYNITDPVSGSEYLPTRTYTFNITWNDTIGDTVLEGQITNVTFETNITGSFVNYTNNTDQSRVVINGTGNLYRNYTINFTGVGPYEIIAYRWIAKNATGTINATPNYTYRISIPGRLAPDNLFYTPQSFVHLNYTNSYATNITIIANSTLSYSNSRLVIDIFNSSSFSGNYSQTNTVTDCTNFNRKLIITNVTHNDTVLFSFNSTNSSEIRLSLVNPTECVAGRYTANLFTLRNRTINESVNVNISLITDIPIAGKHIQLNGIGNFSGSMPINSTYYHSYFFNTSEVENATGITINVTWGSTSQNLDLFLFDNNRNLIAEAINFTHAEDTLVFGPLPATSALYELRIYGNNTAATSYNGNLIFTTINASNTSALNQIITSINFGTLGASNSSQINITLKNEGNISLNGVVETKTIYYINRFVCETTCSGERNFTFVVPDSSIATRIKVNVTWRGDGNYTLNLYKPFNETVDVSSLNKIENQNFTGAYQERFNETKSIVKGVWKIQVKNNSVNLSSYNVSVIIDVNPSSWISTNYSTFSFNRSVYNSVINNTNTTFQFNITVQNDTLDGKYEGFLKYTASNNATLVIPFEVTTRTSTLVVNGTVQDRTLIVPANIGINRTLVLNITFNNTGNYDMPFTFQNSTNNLLMLGTKNISFDYVASPVGSLAANSFGTLNVTINLTVANTSDTQGIYEGFILFNASNITNLTAAAHPYSTFNLTIRVNLTNQLSVSVPRLIGWNTDNNSISTTPNNVTALLQVSNSSGSIVFLTLPNFVKMWLQEGNITGSEGRIPSAGNLSFYANTSPLYGSVSGGYSAYSIDFTAPAGTPGGLYRLHTITNAVIGGNNFTGESDNGTFIVNTPGLYMSNVSVAGDTSRSYTLTNGSSAFLFVNISNYGPVAASSETVELSRPSSCSGYTINALDTYVTSGCSATRNANVFTISPAAHSSSCLVWWQITASDVSASACSSFLIKTPPNGYNWFNNYSISITVSKAGSSTTTTTTPSTTTSGDQTTTSSTLKYLEIVDPGITNVIQNTTNTTKVIVKNTNNTKTQNISLSLESINSAWLSITPSVANLVLAQSNATFTITFNIPSSADVADYTGLLRASSSFTNVTKNFTLRVLPGLARIAEINNTVATFKVNLTELETQINQSRQQGYNVSTVEATFNQLKTLVDQADRKVNSGDYFGASQLFDQIENLFSQADDQLKSASKVSSSLLLPGFGDIFVYIIIGLGVGGGAFLAYLFWPSRGGKKRISVNLGQEPKKEKPKEQPREGRPGKKQSLNFLYKKETVVGTAVSDEDVWMKLKNKWSKLSKRKK